ncbi:MAG: GNAT family N-acetyltransferase [Turicibacter sp.]|nr:GNAT family N-acetyltransferase [Turicibacter sp.]
MSERIEIEQGFIAFIQVADFADIHDVEVLPERRGQGYGAALLRLFLTEMKRRGVSTVTLEVRVDNAVAISLYEKFGFERVAVRKGYYQGVDGWLMKLDKSENLRQN